MSILHTCTSPPPKIAKQRVIFFVILWDQHYTVIKTEEMIIEMKTLDPQSLMTVNTKTLNKILANYIQ